MMCEEQKKLAQVIEKYFGADAGYLDIDCFTLAKRIIEAGWTKPVHCKDCKHWCREAEWMPPECNIFNGGYEISGYPTKPDDFCSYGERKDEYV